MARPLKKAPAQLFTIRYRDNGLNPAERPLSDDDTRNDRSAYTMYAGGGLFLHLRDVTVFESYDDLLPILKSHPSIIGHNRGDEFIAIESSMDDEGNYV